MKRFFFDNEDDDEDEMMDDSGRPMPDFIPEFLAMAHQEDPTRHLLDCAIRVCEKSFLWRFMNHSKKTEMIESVFYDLRELVEPRMDQDSAEEKNNK
jgi:hypothetical protein